MSPFRVTCTVTAAMALLFMLFPARVHAQNASGMPLPEYFGTYVVDAGKLTPLLGGKASGEVTTRTVSLFSFETGAPVTFSVPQFGPGMRFIVFDQSSGDIARDLSLFRLPYGRKFTSQNPDSPYLGGGKSRSAAIDNYLSVRVAAFNMQLAAKPVRGQPLMLEVIPGKELTPGIYALFYFDRKRGRFQVSRFAVGILNAPAPADCVDLVFASGGFGGFAEMHDYGLLHGPPVLLEVTPDHYAFCNRGATNPTTSLSPRDTLPEAQPPTPTNASCTDYDSCLRAGLNAFTASDWQNAATNLKAAASYRPTSGEPWAWLGDLDLAEGKNQDAFGAWDKALDLGRSLHFNVCREGGIKRCEPGALFLDSQEISFIVGNQTQLSAPPSQVSALGPSKSAFKSKSSIALQIGGKHYDFDYFPFGITCPMGSFLHCPDNGVQRQIAVRDYISRTIPKLASGTLGQAPSPSPGPAPSSSTTPNSPSTPPGAAPCGQAVSLGYSLSDGGQIYTVKALGPPGTDQARVFFDQSGGLVSGPLVRRLALGAWTKERIVDRYNPGSGSGQVKMFLAISANLKGWEDATDLLARATVESIKAVVTTGASLDSAVPGLTLGVVKRQLTDPKVALARWAHAGLLQSLADYTAMEGLLPPAGTTTFNLSVLERIESLYTEANTLSSVNEALAAAIAPTTWQATFSNYISSAVDQAKDSLPSSGALWTLKNVLSLENAVGAVGQSFSAYKQSLDLASKVTSSNRQKISDWVTAAAASCSAPRSQTSDAVASAPGAAPDRTNIAGARSNPGVVLLARLLPTMNGNGYWLVPFMQVRQGNYVQLPDGTATNSLEHTSKEDFLSSGDPNPRSPRLAAALQDSPLKQCKDFTVYRFGRKVGSFGVTGVTVGYPGTPQLKVVGEGKSQGFQPDLGDFAICGGEDHAGFRSRKELSPAQRQHLRNLALAQWPKTAPANRAMPELVGKPLRPSDIKERVLVLDMNRDGGLQVFFSLSATMSTNGPTQLPAYASVLAAYDPSRNLWHNLLSCSYVGNVELIAGERTCSLIDVLDINGDGIAKLVFEEGHGEVGDLVIYSFKDNQLHLITRLSGWTGS